MSPLVEIRETSVLPVSPTPSQDDPDSPVVPVDLWVEIDRLNRSDRAMLAERRDDVRRSRQARRAAS